MANISKTFQNIQEIFAPQGTIQKRFTIGTLWTLIGSVFASALSVAVSIMVAREMGKQIYGEFGVIQSTITMFQTFAGFGLGVTATRYVAEFKTKDPGRAGRIIQLTNLVSICTGIITTILFIFLSDWISNKILAAPHLSNTLKLSSAILLLSAINGYQIGTLQGLESFKSIAFLNIMSASFKAIALLVGVKVANLNGGIIGLICALIFTNILYLSTINKELIKFKIKPDKLFSEEWTLLIRFSLPAVLSGAMVAPVTWICNSILVNQPNGYSEMGVYNAANQWWAVILFFPNMVGSVVLPILSSLSIENEKSKFNKIMFLNMSLNSVFTVTLALIISVFAKTIISSYGNDYYSGYLALIILVWSATLASLSKVIGQSIVSREKMWEGFILNGLWAIILIISTWLLRKEGAIGLAKSTFISYAFHLFNSVLYFSWITNKLFFLHQMKAVSEKIKVLSKNEGKHEQKND